jgi:hypothetical protein
MEKTMYELPQAFTDSAGNSANENRAVLLGTIESSNPAATQGDRHKVVLPHRSGESLHAPRQYYYSASRTGVYPALRAGVVQDLTSEAA